MQDPKSKLTQAVTFASVPILLFLGWLLIPDAGYHYKPVGLTSDFDEYVRAKSDRAEKAGVPAENRDLVIRFASGPTPNAFLYLHDRSSSPARARQVLQRISEAYQANVYAPGLLLAGPTKQEIPHVAWLDEAHAALEMMPRLGQKITVLGSGTGALLATRLAAFRPQLVHAVVLDSPFIKAADKPESYLPAGLFDASPLAALTKEVAAAATYRKVQSPALLLYYYKSENDKDREADVQAMLEAFSKFGTATRPHSLNKSVTIRQGAHDLFRSNQEEALLALERFLREVEEEPKRDNP